MLYFGISEQFWSGRLLFGLNIGVFSVKTSHASMRLKPLSYKGFGSICMSNEERGAAPPLSFHFIDLFLEVGLGLKTDDGQRDR